MRAVLNQQSLIWLIGVLQPVSASEVFEHLKLGFGDGGQLPDVDVVHKVCMEQEKLGRLIRVERNPDLFSLTNKGNDLLPRKHRLARDKARIYLLKKARRDRIRASREGIATGLGGAAPPADERPIIKGTEANKLVPVVPSGQAYWPRFSKQLVDETGRSQPSRDIAYLQLVSFDNDKQLAIAADVAPEDLKIDFTTIGLILGISPRLILQICRKPERHYRSFTLKKKGGGDRPIESPKVFLKVIQQFINDYILVQLPQHDCVQSYRSGHSIVTNASIHTGRSYVANIDIEDFFGSLSVDLVQQHLIRNEFHEVSARIISNLCTKDGALPQGASTSPTISNSVLFDFDKELDRYCKAAGLAYSRYADDITVSGDDRDAIIGALEKAQEFLRDVYGLTINRKKTRIASQAGQQRVTGAVVNTGVRPPRVLRRNIRAAFCNAEQAGKISQDHKAHLQGYVSYLMSYPDIRKTEEVNRYRKVLQGVEILKDGE